MKTGKMFHIESIDETHSSTKKLKDMGIQDGQAIEILHVSPMGGTYIIRVAGYSLVLRKSDLKALELKEIIK